MRRGYDRVKGSIGRSYDEIEGVTVSVRGTHTHAYTHTYTCTHTYTRIHTYTRTHTHNTLLLGSIQLSVLLYTYTLNADTDTDFR